MDHSHVHIQKQVFTNQHQKRPKTYFQLIQKVGSNGKYQQNLLYIFLGVFFVTGSILLGTSFLFLNNRYGCDQEGLLASTCKKSVCQIQSQQQKETYFKKNQENVSSIATDYGPFMCDDQFFLDILKSCTYFGSFLGFIVFSYISDNFGRRKTMIMSLGLASLGCILITSGINLIMIAFGVVMAGAGINVSSGIVFYYLGQIVQNLKRQKYSILVQTSYTFGSMCVTILYYFISHWRVATIILQTIPIIATFFIFFFYVQQTPLFLLKGSNKQALRALNRIGNINFGIKQILTEEDIQSVRKQQFANQNENQEKVSPLDLIRFGSLRSTTIIGCLLSYVVYSMYYGPALIIDSIGFNMFVSSIAIQISQLIGMVPCYFYIQKLKRKTTAFFLFLVTIATSFTLSLIQKPQNCHICIQSVIEVVVVFIFRFAICIELAFLLVYSVELFPTKIVGLGVGAINITGTLGSTLSPIILGALKRLEVNLMLMFLILGIVGISLTFLLGQTFGKPLKVQIDEVLFAKIQCKNRNISLLQNQKNKKIAKNL